MVIELQPQHIALTQVILSTHLPHAQLQVFGSRTTGQAKPFSDLDLAVLDDLRFSDRVGHDPLCHGRMHLAHPGRLGALWSQLPQALRGVIEQASTLFNLTQLQPCQK